MNTPDPILSFLLHHVWCRASAYASEPGECTCGRDKAAARYWDVLSELDCLRRRVASLETGRHFQIAVTGPSQNTGKSCVRLLKNGPETTPYQYTCPECGVLFEIDDDPCPFCASEIIRRL